MATRAITPKESFPPLPLAAAPRVKERTKVDVSGPEATPPESKAIPEKREGQKIIKSIERTGFPPWLSDDWEDDEEDDDDERDSEVYRSESFNIL